MISWRCQAPRKIKKMLGIQHGWQIMIIMMLEIYLYSYLGAFFSENERLEPKNTRRNIEIHPRHPFLGGSCSPSRVEKHLSIFVIFTSRSRQPLLHTGEFDGSEWHSRMRCLPSQTLYPCDCYWENQPHNKNGSIQVGIDGGIPNVWSFACLRAGHTSLAQKMVGGEGSAFLLSQKPSQPTQRPITSGAAA